MKISEELFEKVKNTEEREDIAQLLISSGEIGDDELGFVSGGACKGDPEEGEKGLMCPECGSGLLWDYDTSWTTAKCTKCRGFFVYNNGSFIKVE